jgi:hypothetical protein
MKKLVAFCAAAACAGLIFSAAPASALSMKACNEEWNGMKTAGTVGDKKYADFRKECLARTATTPPAAAPAPAPTAATPPKPAPTAAAKPAAPAAPAAAGAAVFPSTVSSKYSSESAGKARMHTCLDQYNANKAGNGNAGLHWIQKGGGYYSQCNTKLKS